MEPRCLASTVAWFRRKIRAEAKPGKLRDPRHGGASLQGSDGMTTWDAGQIPMTTWLLLGGSSHES